LAAEPSILKSVKKVLGLGTDVDEFDEDVVMHINSIFSILHQLGIGPDTGFAIEDEAGQWADFLVDDTLSNSVKTYVFLRVKLLFDPPATSFHISAMERQIQEIEWRLNVKREGESWVDPTPVTTVDPEVVIIPSNQAWYAE
jgi:hypothetical protein